MRRIQSRLLLDFLHSMGGGRGGYETVVYLFLLFFFMLFPQFWDTYM